MGIDFYACKNCGETFPDCGDYENCECGVNWCSRECADADGLKEEPQGFKPKWSSYEQETSCKFCREEDFSDEELLSYCLKELKLSRDELIEEYKKI